MLPHLPRPKTLRLLAGAACLAVSGGLAARQPEPVPPAPPVAPPRLTAPAPSPPAASKGTANAEVTLARSVLAAIDADPVLKNVNVIVSVADRKAVVGGPVRSEDLKKRVDAVVRGVPGIESVKNLCFVHADADPLLRAMAERLKPDAKEAPPAPLPGVALAPAAPAGYLPPVLPEPPSDLLAGMRNTVVAQRAPLPPALLGAPVVATGPGATAPPPVTPPAVPTAPGALTGSAVVAKPADLQAAAVAVCNADPRFARLTVERKPDGTLFVSGWSATTADVVDLRTELRKLPGVGRILVDPALTVK
jgi:hypothetical protein